MTHGYLILSSRFISLRKKNVYGLYTGYRSFCTQEEWRQIPGLAKYQASSFGNIRKTCTGQLRTINYDRFRARGIRARITLSDAHNKPKTGLLSRIILSTFNPVENHHELQVNHKDGNFCNDNLNNLEWCTGSGNMQHAIKLGLIKSHQVKVTVTDIKSRKVHRFHSVNECAEFCRDKKIVFYSRMLQDKAIRNGYKFEYMDDSKYETKVRNFDDEQWKEFHIGRWNRTYFVSNFGRIKCVKPNGKERLMKLDKKYNKLYFRMRPNSKSPSKDISIHRLVATHFVANPNHYKFVQFNDGNQLNIHATNLCWVETLSDIMQNPNVRKKIKLGRKLSAATAPKQKLNHKDI
eukprot:503461_1